MGRRKGRERKRSGEREGERAHEKTALPSHGHKSFNHRAQQAKAGESLRELEASLVYPV